VMERYGTFPSVSRPVRARALRGVLALGMVALVATVLITMQSGATFQTLDSVDYFDNGVTGGGDGVLQQNPDSGAGDIEGQDDSGMARAQGMREGSVASNFYNNQLFTPAKPIGIKDPVVKSALNREVESARPEVDSPLTVGNQLNADERQEALESKFDAGDDQDEPVANNALWDASINARPREELDELKLRKSRGSFKSLINDFEKMHKAANKDKTAKKEGKHKSDPFTALATEVHQRLAREEKTEVEDAKLLKPKAVIVDKFHNVPIEKAFKVKVPVRKASVPVHKGN